MPDPVSRVRVSFDSGDDDEEYVEAQLRYLLEELSEAGVADVERSLVDAPPGTRTGGAVEVGALLIGLGGTGATLPVLIGLLRDWLSRRSSGTLRLKIGEDELELTGADEAMRQRALEDFLQRHPE